MYLAVDVAGVSYFVSELFFSAVGVNFSNLGGSMVITIHLLIGILFTISLLVVKRLSIKFSGNVQSVTTILKFIPLVTAALIGLFVASFGTTNGEASATVNSAATDGSKILKIFAVIPAVLFAYDAFLNVANMQNRVKKGEKRTPFIILLGVSIIVILYTLVGLASALTGKQTVGAMFELAVSSQNSFAKVIAKVIDIFIFISALGVLNGMVMVFDTGAQDLCDAGVFFGSEKAKARYGKNASLIYVGAILAFFFILSALLSIPIGSDILVDGITNYATLLFFLIYGIVIFLYLLKRSEFTKVRKINAPLFFVSATISILGIVVTIVFFIVKIFEDVFGGATSTLGWGGFADGGVQIPSFVPLIMLFLYMLAFPFIHFMNVFLVKREGRDVFKVIKAEVEASEKRIEKKGEVLEKKEIDL